MTESFLNTQKCSLRFIAVGAWDRIKEALRNRHLTNEAKETASETLAFSPLAVLVLLALAAIAGLVVADMAVLGGKTFGHTKMAYLFAVISLLIVGYLGWRVCRGAIRLYQVIRKEVRLCCQRGQDLATGRRKATPLIL